MISPSTARRTREGSVFNRLVRRELPFTFLPDALDKVFALLARKQAVKAVVRFIQLLFYVFNERGGINIGEIFGSFFGGGIDFLRKVYLLVFQNLHEILENRHRLYPLQLQNCCKLVDKGVERIAGRQHQHVAGVDLLVVIHQITEAVQHNHRLAAARAALKDEAFPFGTGDDLVLLFLDRFDDVLDRGFFLAVFDDFPKIGIEKNFLVPSPDLLVRQIFPHGKKFVFEIEHLPVFVRSARRRTVL